MNFLNETWHLATCTILDILRPLLLRPFHLVVGLSAPQGSHFNGRNLVEREVDCLFVARLVLVRRGCLHLHPVRLSKTQHLGVASDQ